MVHACFFNCIKDVFIDTCKKRGVGMGWDERVWRWEGVGKVICGKCNKVIKLYIKMGVCIETKWAVTDKGNPYILKTFKG